MNTEVHVYRAYLCISSERTPLTKAVAKQIPLKYAYARDNHAVQGDEYVPAICKINSLTIDPYSTFSWLILIDTPEEGLLWVRPFAPDKKFADRVIERGGWVDRLEDIPTIILF